MPKAAKAGFYAVRVGREPGIYHSWNDCQAQVNGFQAAKFKKFSTHAEAWEFTYPGRPIDTATSTSRAASTSAAADPSTASTSAAVSRHTRKKPYANTKPVKAPLSHNAFVASAEPDEADFDVVVYTDGACKNNQGGAAAKRAGLGVFFGVSDPRNIAERVPGEQTNNRAELLALVRALEVIPHKQQKVMLKTDSKYSIQCVQVWIHGWIKNGWKTASRQPVANGPIIRYLHALLDERALSGQKVKLVHVAGHAGIAGNEAADRLANMGCVEPALDQEPDWDARADEVDKRKHATAELIRKGDVAGSAAELATLQASSSKLDMGLTTI